MTAQQEEEQTEESCAINQTWCVIDIVREDVVFWTLKGQVLAFFQLMFVT